MNSEQVKTNTSLLSGFGLALIGTTCCALPIVLVTLGMGSVVASVVSVLPWLAWLSQYKAITFSVTALVLAYSGWRLRSFNRVTHKFAGSEFGRPQDGPQAEPQGRGEQCSIEDGKRLKWQKRLLRISAAIFGIAVFAAYALLPITLWLEAV